MNKAYQPESLNKQASVLVDAQTDIKTAIKNGVLSGASYSFVLSKIREIIAKALRAIVSPTLRGNAKKSLFLFAENEYRRFKFTLPSAALLLSACVLMKSVTKSGILQSNAETYIPKGFEERRAAQILYGGRFNTDAKGIPLQEFQKNYIRRVNDALNGLASARALDADDVTGRNSLRNFAEMQVRYEKHLEDIQKLRDDGVKLVVCSVHADCSERCKRWQGRVYSLDGTYGTTEDGRAYVPLEVATDIYYTTKKGKTYKNGLLGFNCRHKLYPYKPGMLIPSVSEAERKREDLITRKQRELERRVIRYREQALMYKGVNVTEYRKAKANAKTAFDEYKAYSKENGRAYYPDRVKVL